MTDYADVDDVKTRRGGDDTTMSADWDDVITAKCAEVSRDLDRMVGRARGAGGDFSIVADAMASSRAFVVPDGGARIVSIDDCISLASIRLTVSVGDSATTLVLGTDYRVVRRKGVIVAIANLAGRWLGGSRIDASARWGLMADVSADLREATAIEVIRSFMGDRAGNNDNLGLSPFGQMTYAKAFTSKVGKFVADWAYGGAALRGSGS